MSVKEEGPAFLLYAQDFYVDCNTWTNEEIGIYTRLLLSEWVNGPLPNDERRLAIAAQTSIKKFRSGWSQIKSKFSVSDDNKLFNRRMEDVRAERLQFIEMQKEKGKKGAEKRWSNQQAAAIAPAMPRAVAGSMTERWPISSSSSVKDKEKNKEQQTPAAAPVDNSNGIVKDIAETVDKLKPLYPRFNSVTFIGSNRKANPKAMLHTLQSLIRAHEAGTDVGDPYAYARATLRIEEGKYNAKDHEAQAAEYKIKPGEAQNFSAIFNAIAAQQGKTT